MKEWKHEEGNWEKYWKNRWDKKWGEEGQKQGAKYQEMGKIMNKLGETQFKTAKLVMELANKKSDAEFKKALEHNVFLAPKIHRILENALHFLTPKNL